MSLIWARVRFSVCVTVRTRFSVCVRIMVGIWVEVRVWVASLGLCQVLLFSDNCVPQLNPLLHLKM